MNNYHGKITFIIVGFSAMNTVESKKYWCLIKHKVHNKKGITRKMTSQSLAK